MFNDDNKDISHFALVFLLLALIRQIPARLASTQMIHL